MNKYVKLLSCMFLITALLKAEINKDYFDIKTFKKNLKEYPTTKNAQMKSACFSMFNKISNEVPSNLKSTYEALTKLMRNAFDAADVLYAKVKSQDPRLVAKSIDALVKEQASAKRSFFGTKLIQGAKNLFAKKDKKEEYNDMKKLFSDIFDGLSEMINKMKDDSKKFKGALLKDTMKQINPF